MLRTLFFDHLRIQVYMMFDFHSVHIVLSQWIFNESPFFVFMVARTYKDFIRDHLGGGCKHVFFVLPLLEEMIHFDQYLSHGAKPQTSNYPPYNKQLAHANQRVGRWILFWDGYFQGICWFQGGYHVDSRRRPTANHSAKSWAPRTNAPCFVVKCLDWRWDETNNIPTTTNAIYKQKIT